MYTAQSESDRVRQPSDSQSHRNTRGQGERQAYCVDIDYIYMEGADLMPSRQTQWNQFATEIFYNSTYIHTVVLWDLSSQKIYVRARSVRSSTQRFYRPDALSASFALRQSVTYHLWAAAAGESIVNVL